MVEHIIGETSTYSKHFCCLWTDLHNVVYVFVAFLGSLTKAINGLIIINQANKVGSISDRHSYTPERVNHSVADLQALSTKIWGWLYVMQMVVSKTKTKDPLENEDPLKNEDLKKEDPCKNPIDAQSLEKTRQSKRK